MTYTIKAKIKQTATLVAWLDCQFRLAARLYNACLEAQFEKAACGERLHSTADLCALHRSFSLGSDYKDRTIERAVKATTAWYQSESLRYELYWKNKEKHQAFPQVSNTFKALHLRFFLETEQQIARQDDLRNFVRNLSRKQKIIGRPRPQKSISLAFAIRSNRQDTVKIREKTVEVAIPKFKGFVKGRHNRLPFASDFSFVQGVLKKDRCGDLWLCLVVEGQRSRPALEVKESTEKVIVGIDLGLKSARTVVAVVARSKAIKEIYQPDRVNHFNLGYQALVQSSNHNRRALPFVHRKIARRRHDNIGKDVFKILAMGDEFKLGKPSAAWLLSGRLARSAADAANSKFATRLAKRAKEAGKETGEVNESYTSQTCRMCGGRKKMPLSVRTYECEKKGCGHVENRDINAAYQIAFLPFDEKKRTKAPKKMKTGVLPRRGMKARASERDFQAKPPCKLLTSVSGGAELGLTSYVH